MRGAAWCQRFHAALLARGCAWYDRAIEPRKRTVFGGIEGKVVEIGAGTGASLPFFRPGIQWIGIEPNPHMHAYLRRTAERLGVSADVRIGTAEALPVGDASVDAVVSSLVLCTVDDVAQVVREIVRVLKPGGRFVFIEHVAAPAGSWSRRIQRAIRPLWALLAGGCRPDRETWTAIEQGGFTRVELEHFRVRVPIAGPHIAGVATK